MRPNLFTEGLSAGRVGTGINFAGAAAAVGLYLACLGPGLACLSARESRNPRTRPIPSRMIAAIIEAG